MKKEAFKEFVRKNPSLASHVNNGNMTWQKFYEMYTLYDEDMNAWGDYLNKKDVKETQQQPDLFSFLKNLNMDSVQENIKSIERVLGVIGEMAAGSGKEDTNTYRPRPMYKHFDD